MLLFIISCSTEEPSSDESTANSQQAVQSSLSWNSYNNSTYSTYSALGSSQTAKECSFNITAIAKLWKTNPATYNPNKGIIVRYQGEPLGEAARIYRLGTNYPASNATASPSISFTYEPVKIMIDVGHQTGENSHNHGTFMYYECNQMQIIKNYLIPLLTAKGFQVDEIRSNYNKMVTSQSIGESWSDWMSRENYARGKKAEGYDLLISLHSNAIGDGAQTSRNEIIVFHHSDASSNFKTFSDYMATAVKTAMGTPQGGYAKSTNFAILRGAFENGCKNALLIEHSYHDNKTWASWLMNSSNLYNVAVAEAQAIETYLYLLF